MSVASSLSLTPLTDGSLNSAPVGAHIVLEAAGILLHVVRVPEGLIALRRGSVQSFHVARMPPAAALVRYPPPFGPLTDAEAVQAAERARSLIGLDVAALTERLVRAGANAADLNGEARAGECLASFCATGAARCWKVSEAYHLSRNPPASVSKLGSPDGPLSRSSAALATSTTADPQSLEDIQRDLSMEAPGSNEKQGGYAPCASEAVVSTEAPRNQLNHSNSQDAFQLNHTIREKAISTAVHAGLRGPAAKVAGAAAAIGCEGYALYKEVGDHSDKLDDRKISNGQFKDRCAESTITSSGRAIGGLAGAVAGQASIPIPVVGAMVGGVVGAACGGFHANSFSKGAFRLSGNRAKGGDDLVRCIEHKPRDAATYDDSDRAAELPSPSPDLFSSPAPTVAERPLGSTTTSFGRLKLEEDFRPASATPFVDHSSARAPTWGGLEEEEQLL